METSSGTVRGTCQQMCSEKETLLRETEGLLHQLEALTIKDDNNVDLKTKCLKADPSKTIKQFSRPAAGRAEMNPSDLRPASVLKGTVTYLFESIIPKEHPAWSGIYEFVFDRLRAVRQDMVIQGIVGSDAIVLLEQIIRFHLYASYRLRTSDLANFDPVINNQHLLECLKRLLYLYQITPGCHVNQPEFESVYLLSNLGDNSALSHCLDLRPDIRRNQIIRQSYEISMAYVLRNYARTLRLISKLQCVMCLCAVNPHLSNLRINYLQILSAGYSIKNCTFPILELKQLLCLPSDNETVSLCSQSGLIDMFDNTSSQYVCFNRSMFSQPVESKVSLSGEKNLTVMREMFCKVHDDTAASLPVLDKLLKQTSITTLLLGYAPGCQGVRVPDKATKGIGRGRGRGRRVLDG